MATPTGKPPGRPRKDGLPAGSVAKDGLAEGLHSPFHIFPMSAYADRPCQECFPGVTQFNAVTCAHGTFIRKA